MDSPEYKPHPLDTANVELNEDLQANIEALARNNHEVWASARAAEGWKYGPARNDAGKEHPGMVPYDKLSDGEKDIDRGTVLQTLKAAAVLGFDIGRRSPGELSAAEKPKNTQRDDMREWPPWPASVDVDVLGELETVREAIGNVYIRANRSAGRNLFFHKITAPIVAFCGSGAVGVAIYQLYNGAAAQEAGSKPPVLAWVEFIFALIALLAVAFGLWRRFMRRWLVQRHQAEGCRFLKFDFLMAIASASRDRVQLLAAAAKFRKELEELDELEYPEMDEWLEEDHVLKRPPPTSPSQTVLDDMRVLSDHYLQTRLAIQSRYFSHQASHNNLWNVWTQNLPALLFFASIAFAAAHFGIDVFAKDLKEKGRFLIFLAALAPLVGSCIRALRGVWEYSRNTLRFEAKHNALKALIEDLESKTSGQADALDLQHLLWKGEQILEGEHREWLRLMMETEWIG